MNFHSEPITFVGKVSLKVENLERSLTFYKEIMGFKILEQTDRTAKLTVDGKTTLLSIEQPKKVIKKHQRTTGLFHFALLLPNRSELGNLLKHFIQIGYPLQGAADHLVSEAVYLADPDGNGIEVYSDRNPSEWKWEEGEVVMPSDPLNAEDVLAAAEEGNWNGLPFNTVMGHIHLHVSDLKDNQKFYTEGLGFEIVSRYGNHALFISEGKYHHHIALNIWNGIGAPQPPAESVGLESFTLVFGSKKKRDEIINQLKSIGTSVNLENGLYVTTDPSGNRILLYA